MEESKMTTNKFITAAAVLALSTSLAVAAPHGGKGFGKHGRNQGAFGAHFAEKLNLSDAQKAQIRDLNKSFREQNKTFFEQVRQTRQDARAAKQAGDAARLDSLKGTMEAQRAQMKQLRDGQKQRVLSILTPEQRQQFEAMKAERQSRRGNRQ
jgi:Spy/CpxP family protein refolding chaperone